MIVPWLKGFLSWNNVPMTWTLVFLNIFVFLLTYQTRPGASSIKFLNKEQIQMTGQLYHQYKGGVGIAPFEKQTLLGGQALRDFDFVSKAMDFKFQGDPVEIKIWKEGLAKFKESQSARMVSIFGLSFNKSKPATWITYQFMHASWMHLIGNMLMLLLFAAALELKIGMFGVMTVYILGGLMGALGFLALGTQTMAPMIGASGSLSAVMSFYVISEHRKRIPYFYFLSPIEGYFGWIYLPTLLIFPLMFVSDVAAYLSANEEFGSGVAYTAHLGGMAFGIVLGYLCLKLNLIERDSGLESLDQKWNPKISQDSDYQIEP